MSRDSSLDNNPMEDSQDSEETCEQFEEVRKCFSEEEWAKLGNLGQKICVYMRKNYEYLIGQGLVNTVPGSTHPNNQTTEARKHDSDEALDPGIHGLVNTVPGSTHPNNQTTEARKHDSDEALDPGIHGLVNTVPGSTHPNNQTTEARKHDSDEALDPGIHGSFQADAPVLELTGSGKEETNVWLGRLRERTNYIIYEEISDPEEDD